MTPEPNGGYYFDAGPKAFLRKFGYADAAAALWTGSTSGGVHRFGARHATTKLELALSGWDVAKGAMTRVDGGIELLDAKGPSLRAGPSNRFSTTGSESMRRPCMFPATATRSRAGIAMAKKSLPASAQISRCYWPRSPVVRRSMIPASSLENASGIAVLKRRSQFRIQMKDIAALYEKTEWLDLPAAH